MTALSPLEEFDLQRPTVEGGLALDEALLESICQGERRFGLIAWSSTDHALVMPRRHERLEGFPMARRALLDRGWPILFRSTGGTPVPQSPAVVNVALALRCRVGSSAAHLEWGYRRLGDPWCDWLASLGVQDADLGSAPGAYCDGRFNVRIAGRKLVGTAQRWRRVRGCKDMAMLAHGAMQVGETPEALVEVVNAFQDAIGDPQRFHAASHVALAQALPGLDLDSALPGLLERLAEAS
ncbi:lipoate--protein ligase family protein [Halomonas sp. LBP4]|uniref:lipoate--protein ligase family protein n=1 Tax=Halomonas sp. LBP4 TaxID=2044917 RepID=UPI000D770842|nr:lipoate--protein ligase family protein [Halomonas sp. LBP4]PXX99357.1 lipoate--protein ligase [Halomonas sp. LBP4]